MGTHNALGRNWVQEKDDLHNGGTVNVTSKLKALKKRR